MTDAGRHPREINKAGKRWFRVGVVIAELFLSPDIDRQEHDSCRERTMFGLVVTFLIVGLIAAVLGFGGIAGASFGIAKLIFFVALILLLLSIVFGTVRRV
jgi:uncharacterized membrane protein YtjA (UPF0391 family)